MIRRFKPAYQLYNFFKREKLAHNLPLFHKYGLRKRYFDPISSTDFRHLPADPPLFDTVDSAKHLPDKPAFQALPPSFQQAMLPWSRDGYVILRGLFPKAQVDTINREIEQLLEHRKVGFKYGGRKIMFAFHRSEAVRRAGEEGVLKNILELLLDKPVRLFQSINFIEASEQRTHSDSIHMTTYPLGNLIAAWVALEDIGPEQGPLHYYPGSHRMPYLLNREMDNTGSRFFLGKKTYADYEDRIQELVAAHELEKKIFLPQKGDVLIWHANLLHGGEPVRDTGSTRKSMVFHYFGEDAICYHEITQRPALLKP